MTRADVEGGGCAPVAGDDAVYGGGRSPESGEDSRRSRRFRRDRSRSVRASSLDRGSAGCWIPVDVGMLRALFFVPGSSRQSQPEAAREGTRRDGVMITRGEQRILGCLFTW